MTYLILIPSRGALISKEVLKRDEKFCNFVTSIHNMSEAGKFCGIQLGFLIREILIPNPGIRKLDSLIIPGLKYCQFFPTKMI